MAIPATLIADKREILYDKARTLNAQKRKGTQKPIRRNKIPVKERVQALLALKDNGFDFVKTAAELGLSERTLSRWKKDMGREVYREDEHFIEENLDEIEKEVAITRSELIITNNQILAEAVSTEFEIIQRIREVAKTATNLFALANSLKILHEITSRKVAGKDDGGYHTLSQTNSFTQFIEKQVIQMEEDIKWRDEKLGQGTRP